jgi:MoaA/NifB/PqqE/SkfB family radical SAM enzyme
MPYSPLKVFHHQDRLRVLREGGQPAPLHLEWSIADVCNHDCPWCAFRLEGYASNQLFGETRPDGTRDNNPKRFIPYEKAVEVLDDCVALGVKAVQLTGGGEPTAHPRHLDIMRGVLDRGLDLALVSNATIFRDGLIPLLLRAKWCRFSLDAGNAETYARTRRVPTTYFDRYQQNVRSLCDARDEAGADVVVGVGFVVSKDNWREVVDAARIARDIGADNIRISALFQNDGAAYFADFHDEAAALCREAEALTGDGFRVFNNFGLRLADLEQKAPDYSFCGQQHFTVFLGGDQVLYRCCVLAFNERGKIGSIKEQSLRTLWESEAKRRDYAAFDATGCARCMFNGKNRTIAYAVAKDPPHVNFV